MAWFDQISRPPRAQSQASPTPTGTPVKMQDWLTQQRMPPATREWVAGLPSGGRSWDVQEERQGRFPVGWPGQAPASIHPVRETPSWASTMQGQSIGQMGQENAGIQELLATADRERLYLGGVSEGTLASIRDLAMGGVPAAQQWLEAYNAGMGSEESELDFLEQSTAQTQANWQAEMDLKERYQDYLESQSGVVTPPYLYEQPEGEAPVDAYGRQAVWNTRLGQWDYTPGWGSLPAGQMSPYDEAQLDLARQMSPYDEAQLELSRQQLANDRQQMEATQAFQFAQLQQDWSQAMQERAKSPRSWIEYWQMEHGTPPTAYNKPGVPSQGAPQMPAWLQQQTGGWQQPYKTPSSQQWQGMTPSQQQGYLGYVDYAPGVTEMDLIGQTQRLWPQAGGRRGQWLPASQR